MIINKIETTRISQEQIDNLWEAFTVFDENGDGNISVEELGQVLRSLGQSPSQIELRDMMKEVDVDLSGRIDFGEFKTLMTSQQGDRQSRLKLAFSVFDEDSSGQITADEMQNVMSKFGLTEQELEEMIQEVDSDGDGAIDFEEFCMLVPEEAETTTGYQDWPITPARVTDKTVSNNTCTVTESKPETDLSALDSEVAGLKKLLAQHPQPEQKRGTSRLQMQIGLFRLLQGAAYRCFRESFSANHETHLRVKDLPYRITDFVRFVTTAIQLYQALGVVESACNPILDAVVESITAEFTRLQERIENWQTVEKTPEMLASAAAMIQARKRSATVKQKFAAGVEFAITLKKKKFSFRDVTEGILAINELNRLRKIDLNAEFAPSAVKSEGEPKDYLKQWHRVILTDASEEIDGAMIPVAYWYEDFMPKLLAAFSVTTAADIQSNTIPDEVALNQWYESTQSAGEFGDYATDLALSFSNCTAKQKLMLQQAWRLTHYYLNGVQKRRERLEFGRESGALSQYVAFIDVFVGRSDVKDAQMRVSFPYYIGPAVWRFFHTTAEIVCTLPLEEQRLLAETFKDFFRWFASMYPCPYCRHHLNMYVVQNKEVEMYPVEYLLLGRDPNLTHFEVSMDAKLSTVVDGASLRLFFWKLHNTVSSSIARSEEWYHKDEKAFYTTRFWPSLDSELARAKALKQISISIDRIYRLYGLLKPVARLAGVKATLQELLEIGDDDGIREACIVAENYIKELEQAAIDGGFLQEIYSFDPNLIDQAPSFTPEEEEFARSGVFVETT